MPPRYLINKRQGTVFPYSDALATNPDLEPFYGDESTQEGAGAADEVTGGAGPETGETIDEVVDPETGAILDSEQTGASPAPNEEPPASADDAATGKKKSK